MPEQETRMTPKVKVEQWMRDAVSKMHVKACGKSCKRSDCEKDVEEATKIIASEYSQAHPPAGESAHEDGWVSRATKSAPIMQDCMVVVRRYSEGIFLDQWQQVAWRRPDGRWIDDEDLVESSDRYDNRVIEFWHKLKALPSAPEKEKR